MKSVKIHSFDSGSKLIKYKNSAVKVDTSLSEKPTPLDFDSFIPWLCLELQVAKNVVVTRTNQAEYVQYSTKLPRVHSTKSSKLKSKWRITKTKSSTLRSNSEHKMASANPVLSFIPSTVKIADAIPVTTSYDKHGRLVEVEIVGCPFEIPRKVIQAFNLCLPFHSRLFKLSIRKGGVCQTILYEISKLLLHSHITEICLDDSKVPEGDYSILLDRPSKIKYLSLKRCGITDEECKRIASKLDLKGPALKNLLLLDLTSNNINDDGAQALGETLKTNRHLRYLNLAGNNISDIGVSFILQYLQKFPLTSNDINQTSRMRMDYLINKSITYQKCLEEVKLARLENTSKKDVNISAIQFPHHRKHRKHTLKHEILSVNVKPTIEDEAEKKTIEILGELESPFAEQYITRKSDLVYAIGNLTLTYLNLAYNNLSLLSVRKILKILQYQSRVNKLTTNIGLVKVVIDGNNIPKQCDELHEIDLCLKRIILHNEDSISL